MAGDGRPLSFLRITLIHLRLQEDRGAQLGRAELGGCRPQFF